MRGTTFLLVSKHKLWLFFIQIKVYALPRHILKKCIRRGTPTGWYTVIPPDVQSGEVWREGGEEEEGGRGDALPGKAIFKIYRHCHLPHFS